MGSLFSGQVGGGGGARRGRTSLLRNANVACPCRFFSLMSLFRNQHVPLCYRFYHANVVVTKAHVTMSNVLNVHVALSI